MKDKKAETKKVDLHTIIYDDNTLTPIEKLAQDLKEITQKFSLLRLIDDTKKFMQSEGTSCYYMFNPSLDYAIVIYYKKSRRNEEKSLKIYFKDTDQYGKVLEYDFRNYKLKNYEEGDWQKFLRSQIPSDN